MRKFRIGLSFGAWIAVIFFASESYSQTKVPRFESSPCPTSSVKLPPEVKPECGFLVVAQDRSKPEGKTFRLAVAILRAVPASSDSPIIILHGGPSGPGGVVGGEGAMALSWVPKLRRDIIVYDQRGAGLSEPKLCPEAYARPEQYLQASTDKEREEVGMSQSRACVASLRSNGIDPDMFGTEINAQDLADLRKTLGVSKWNVFGASYGGRLAQEAIRHDPDGIRSVVMHSPSIITAGSESDMPLTRQHLAEQIFAACKADPECASTFPNFEKDFFAVYEELKQKPIDITVQDARGPVKVRLDGYRFIRTATNPGSVPVSKMPLVVKELLNGDRMRAGSYLLSRRVATGVGNNALTELVGCYDGYGPVYAKRVAEVSKQVRAEFRVFENTLEQCPTWHSRFTSDAAHQLAKSDIPTLVLTAEFDDRTPTAHGKRIASALKNSYHFELPGKTHGGGLTSGCGESIIFQFLKDPRRRPDSSCLASMAKVKFELKSLETPTLFVSIKGGEGKPTAFDGTWGAFYPSIEPGAVRFQLRAEGNKLTGTYQARGDTTFDIYDGSINGDTISFKIKSPEGTRTITFTGVLKEDELSFAREVEVQPGGRPGGAYIWGSAGPKTFSAARVQ